MMVPSTYYPRIAWIFSILLRMGKFINSTFRRLDYNAGLHRCLHTR